MHLPSSRHVRLLTVLVLTLPLGCRESSREPDPQARNEGLIQAARQLGAKVEPAASAGDKLVVTLTWKGQTLGDPELAATRAFDQVSYLDVSDSELNVHWYKDFSRIVGMAKLDLTNTRTDDLDLERIFWNGEMTGLTALGLAGTDVTDSGLPLLENTPNLVLLDLEQTAISDAGLTNLPPLEKLKTIRLNGSAVTESGVASLRDARPELTVHWEKPATENPSSSPDPQNEAESPATASPGSAENEPEESEESAGEPDAEAAAGDE
jgi:hypothetical protein